MMSFDPAPIPIASCFRGRMNVPLNSLALKPLGSTRERVPFVWLLRPTLPACCERLRGLRLLDLAGSRVLELPAGIAELLLGRFLPSRHCCHLPWLDRTDLRASESIGTYTQRLLIWDGHLRDREGGLDTVSHIDAALARARPSTPLDDRISLDMSPGAHSTCRQADGTIWI